MKAFLVAIAAVIAFGGEALALSLSYDATVDLSKAKINNGRDPIIFSFTGINAPFVAGISSPTISLTFSQGSTGFTDRLSLLYEDTFLKNITASDTSYTFSGAMLAKLNADILNDHAASFKLSYGSGGASTVGSARLSGTVAPEPVSMALVGAGLVGLPFARRLRRSFKQAV
ncbi:hypothetical protein [Geobacter sp.]|uniref:hypothetical protein n=1 Tax=Geobacter sp. TaxID=46610 RepID=UPI002616EB0E|nr:hypothetical protein [Geobacter sp.]